MARAVATTLRFQEIWTPSMPKFSYHLHIFSAVFFLTILVARVSLRQSVTGYGYKIADAQEETVLLTMEKQELELIQSIELRRDNLFSKARQIGLVQPKSEQVWSFVKE